MKERKAINKLAIAVLVYKPEVIKEINQLGLGNLPSDASQEEVNKIFINNLDNKEFISRLDSAIRKDSTGYVNDFGITAIILASLIIVGTGVYVGVAANSARKQRQEIIAEQRRATYLSDEERDEVALINRKNFQNMFLEAQADYLNKEERQYAKEVVRKKKNIAMILSGGMVVMITATFLLR